MTFHEQRLDLGINYGATFGPRFNTAILTQSDGQEQRRALWSQPLILAQLGDRRVTQSELNTLLAFHATVKGAAIGFRLRDWSDYKATNQAIGTGNGAEQTWQLVKTYAISTATVKRPITKPVSGSVVVYLDGVEEENGWSVDTTTGVLTTELTGAIAVDFEFDVPVRFEQDKIDFTFEAKGLFTLAPLTCTEIRVEPTIYPTLDTLPGSLEEIIDLGYDFGTLGGPAFSTGIKGNAAEFELRKSRWESSLGSWDIGDRLLIRSELDYLIRLFRVCRGMAIPFRFKDWQTNTVKDVRFAEDRISFRFEAYSEAEVIFNLGGMAVTAITAIAPPACTPKSLTFTDPLTSPWAVVSQETTGIYSGATYDLDTSGGFWRQSLTFGDGVSGYAASIIYLSNLYYAPKTADEIINISFSLDMRFVSKTGGGGNSHPCNLIAFHNGNVYSLSANNCFGNTNWNTYTSSYLINFPVTPNSSIVFGLQRSNSSVPSDFNTYTRVIDMKNLVIGVNVTCPS